MRKLSLIILTAYLNLFSQVDTTRPKIPEIELPDFVITGQATVTLQQQNKQAPELLTPLSKEFILPRIKIQELKLEGLSDPAKQQPAIIDSTIKYSGRAKTNIGLYLLPQLEAFYSGIWNKYSFAVGGDFIRSRDYEKNSRFIRSNFLINNTIIIEKENQTPARLSFSGQFNYFNYSNFKSVNSNEFKSISNFNLQSNLENLFYRAFNLSFGGDFDYQKLGVWNYSFVELSAFGKLRSTFEHFELTASAQPYIYKVSKDSTRNSLILSAYGEMYFRKLFKILNIITRVDYQTENEERKQFLAPSIRFGFKLSDYWNLTLFYENKLINLTTVDLWNINPYLDSSEFNYSIERIKNKFGFGTIIYFDRRSNLKFELSRYNIAGKNNFIADTTKVGYFKILKDEAESFEVNTFLFLDLEKYGNIFIGSKYLISSLKKTTRQAPHTPKFHGNFTYDFKFDFPLSLRFSFLYNSIKYGDLYQKMTIGSYANLELSANYQLTRFLNVGIELNNLMNKKNILWFNYEEKPIDVLLYLKARF